VRLRIKSRKLPLTEDIRTHVEERVGSALDHVPFHILAVDVNLVDVNGPRGGKDKLCRIRIQLDDGGSIVVSEPDISEFRAVDRATTRAKRLVNERLRKRIHHRRNRDSIRDLQIVTEEVDDDIDDIDDNIDDEVETPDLAVERTA
jgi:ribosome-associated translation inhibitor RaiA